MKTTESLHDGNHDTWEETDFKRSKMNLDDINKFGAAPIVYKQKVAKKCLRHLEKIWNWGAWHRLQRKQRKVNENSMKTRNIII